MTAQIAGINLRKEITPKADSTGQKQDAQERFVIEEITPVPTGSPDDIWATIKQRLSQSSTDPFFVSMMEHGNLISVGPTAIEIGFNKAFYQSQFESRLAEKPELKEAFRDVFGNTPIKTLTLAEETTLKNPNPYENNSNGETDRNRALKQEALDHPIVQAVQEEFEDSAIQEIKILL